MAVETAGQSNNCSISSGREHLVSGNALCCTQGGVGRVTAQNLGSRLSEPRKRCAPRLCRASAILLTAILLTALWAAPSMAQSSFFGTHLVDIGQSAGLSSTAASLADGGYELSDGSQIRFADWYHTDWPEVHVDMLTQLSEGFGLFWGMSSGERAEKYVIEPGLRLGFIAQTQPTQNSVLSLTVKTILAGRLTEQLCEADYGEIGGVQPVNCRLAASQLPPDETLQYLVNAEPSRLNVALSFRASF